MFRMPENFKTVGIASDENKLKLAAILFDRIYNIDKSISVPKSLIVESKIWRKIANPIPRPKPRMRPSKILSATRDAIER